MTCWIGVFRPGQRRKDDYPKDKTEIVQSPFLIYAAQYGGKSYLNPINSHQDADDRIHVTLNKPFLKEDDK